MADHGDLVILSKLEIASGQKIMFQAWVRAMGTQSLRTASLSMPSKPCTGIIGDRTSTCAVKAVWHSCMS
jgi:hypothetical protein